VLIIPPQWRATDIVFEMERAGISIDLVLIEHQGRLIDFRREEHPYRKLDNPPFAARRRVPGLDAPPAKEFRGVEVFAESAARRRLSRDRTAQTG